MRSKEVPVAGKLEHVAVETGMSAWEFSLPCEHPGLLEVLA